MPLWSDLYEFIINEITTVVSKKRCKEVFRKNQKRREKPLCASLTHSLTHSLTLSLARSRPSLLLSVVSLLLSFSSDWTARSLVVVIPREETA